MSDPSTPWDDASTADPIGDLRAFADKIQSESASYRPTTILMSRQNLVDYESWQVWSDETIKRLRAVPRWRWIMRMVIRHQLYGPWHRRSHHLRRLRWKIQDWHRGEDWS